MGQNDSRSKDMKTEGIACFAEPSIDDGSFQNENCFTPRLACRLAKCATKENNNNQDLRCWASRSLMLALN